MGSLQYILLAICGLLHITTTTALDLHHLPYRIKPNSSCHTPRSIPPAPINGLCYNHTVQAAETCDGLAQRYEVTVAEIETWNTGNYCWKGCNGIKQGDFICLSPGAPPMPVALPQATCGPQVPGTARPSDYSILSSLNPCPSSQCCTSEGQCSTNTETCTSNICISNCGPKSSGPAQSAPAQPAPAPRETTQTVISKTTTTFHTTTTTTTKPTHPPPPTTSSPTTSDSLTWTATISVHPFQTEPPPWDDKATWKLSAYFGWHCNKDYFVVQGHAASNGTCLQLHSLSSEYTETGVWCKYYTDGGFNSTSCDQIPDKGQSALIYSWGLSGGSCTAFADPQCNEQLYQQESFIHESACEPETESRPHMLIDWVALKCSLNG